MDNGGAFTDQLLDEAGIAPGMRVLDVGCGSGDVTLRLARIVGPQGCVTGLDRDEAALGSARDRAKREGHGHVDFVAGDLDGSALPSGSYDAVVGRRVLMYLPDPRRALRALGAVLRPGAVLAFQEHDSALVGQEPLPLLHGRIHDLLWRTIALEGGNVHMGLALATALREAGFTVTDVRVEATMLLPEVGNPIARLVAVMLPRMMAAGIAAPGEFDLDRLDGQLADELKAADTTPSWETIFGVRAKAA